MKYNKYYQLLKIVFLGIILSAHHFIYGQETQITNPEALGFSDDRLNRIDEIFNDYVENDKMAGSVILVARKGKVGYFKAFGQRDRASQSPMDKDVIFRIASQTKAIISVGIMMLQEQGKLLIQDPLSKYIPEFKNTTVAEPAQNGNYKVVEANQEITLRHLLTHTAGIGYGYGPAKDEWEEAGIQGWYFADRNEPIAETVERMASLPMDAKPGSKWVYGYSTDILGVIIERASGMQLDQFLKNNIFDPLEMNHTLVRENPGQIVEDRSTGYVTSEKGTYEAATDIAGAMGAGGMYTTMADLSIWINQLLDPQIGTQKMIEEMTSPFVLTNGDTTNYGLGLFIGEYKGLDYFHHGGADVAHRSMLMVFPEINASVVTQSNFGGFSGNIPNKVTDTFFKEYLQKPDATEDEPSDDTVAFDYDPENFDPLTGRYELEIQPGFILSFDRDGDRLYTQATNQPEIDLTATSDSTFSLVGIDASVTFHLNEDNSADSLTLHQNGHHVAHKVDWNPSHDELIEYTGSYFSQEIQSIYTITIEDSSLVLKNYHMEDMVMNPGNIDEFSAGFPLGSIEFIRNDIEMITGFSASNGRTRDVYFEKRDDL